MSTTLDLRVRDEVATFTLVPDEGRPTTLDHAVLGQFDASLDALEAGSGVRVLYIRSASPKYFCVGANLEVLRSVSAATIGHWLEHGQRVFDRIEALPIPTVARVEGYALGGGLELALACDLIFASEAAQFGQTEAKLGFIPGWGGSWRLPRRIGAARARMLFYTGRMIPARAGEASGLADFVGSAEALEQECTNVASAIRGVSAVALAEYKTLLASSSGRTPADAGRAEILASGKCVAAPDTAERLRAFFARKK